MPDRIVVNGVEYASIDEMPPHVRSAYEQAMVRLPDADRDGTPDVLQCGSPSSVQITTETKYTVNGVEYASFDAMPPEIRAIVRRAERGGDLRPGDPAPLLAPRRPGLRLSCGACLALAAIAVAAPSLGRRKPSDTRSQAAAAQPMGGQWHPAHGMRLGRPSAPDQACCQRVYASPAELRFTLDAP